MLEIILEKSKNKWLRILDQKVKDLNVRVLTAIFYDIFSIVYNLLNHMIVQSPSFSFSSFSSFESLFSLTYFCSSLFSSLRLS
jgi:hypothetical protein